MDSRVERTVVVNLRREEIIEFVRQRCGVDEKHDKVEILARMEEKDGIQELHSIQLRMTMREIQ